jgi:hypothetical protein
MQAFSAKQRANLASYGCDIAEEIAGSNGNKQNVTQDSRARHFLEWCVRMDVTGDPLLPQHDLQARNYLIACFAVSLSRGETLQNRGAIMHATISKYVQAVCKLHKDRTYVSPYKAPIDFISIVLKAVKKYEKKKDRREMITDEMFHCMEAKRHTLDPDSREAALIDWYYLGRFVGYRSIEWCQKKQKEFEKITHRLWSGPSSYAFIIEDFELFRYNGQQILDLNSAEYEDIAYFNLRIRKQKNNRNYEIIPYKKDLDNAAFCPVHSMLRIIRRALRLQVPAEEPIAVYMSKKGKYKNTRCFITNSDVAASLRKTAQVVYKLKKGDPALQRWTSHSIRVTACNLLHRQGLSDTYIQTRLRWCSNAFLGYLRNTLYSADAHTKALNIPANNLPALTANWEVVKLASGEEVCRNSAHGRPLQRRRGLEELESVLHARAA